MSGMRLFAAVVPPEPVLAELAGAVARLRALPGADLLRWTEPAGWHLALAFYGEVDQPVVPALRERLAVGARRHPPERLRFAGGGHFSHRVLWAGVEGDRAELRRLAEAAEAGARRAGLPMAGRRPYRPHLTLARNRAHAGLAPFASALADFAGTPWVVTEFRLLRSHLPVGGEPGGQPRYETVAAWPLGGERGRHA